MLLPSITHYTISEAAARETSVIGFNQQVQTQHIYTKETGYQIL